MSPSQSLLSRHRALLTLAAGTVVVLTILAVTTTSLHHQRATPLRRRNAVRRSRRSQSPSVQLLRDPDELYPLGAVVIIRDGTIVARLQALDQEPFGTVEDLMSQLHVDPDTSRDLYQQAILLATRAIVKACCDGPTYLVRTVSSTSTRLPLLLGFSQDVRTQTREWVADHHADTLIDFINAPSDMTVAVHRTILEELQRYNNHQRAQLMSVNEPLSSDIAPDQAASSQQATADELKGMLYYIAEEQAKRKAVQHYGVRCEECGEHPIRNVRWSCLNCPDYDLCSTCKSQTIHQRNHIFAEIKIPIPVLSQSVSVAPLMYPGNDIAILESLSPASRQRLAQHYDFEEPEIDALAEQFCCLANVRLSDDSSAYLKAAIDHDAFVKATTPPSWAIRQRLSLLTERMFRFYDVNNDGWIDFEEFLSGLSYLRGKNRFDPIRRALTGFDFDGDGLVGRSHFLKLLKAKFDMHRMLVEQVAECEEAVFSAQNEWRVHEGHPTGTIFHGEIPHGEQRSTGNEKVMDSNENLVPPPGIEITRPRRAPQTDQPSADTVSTTNIIDTNTSGTSQLTEADRVILGLAPRPAGSEPIVERSHGIVLWDIVEASIDESLDIIFRSVEALQLRLQSTETERRRWQKEIEMAAQSKREGLEQLEAGAGLDPLVDTAYHTVADTVSSDDWQAIQLPLRHGMVPTDARSLDDMEAELDRLSLDLLLEASGYAVALDNPAAMIAGPSSPSNTTSTYLDPTMPQNKPNSTMEGSIARRNTMESTPSRARLEYLAQMDLQAQRLHIKHGEACLTLDDIEAMAKADHTKDIYNIIKSWLSGAAL